MLYLLWLFFFCGSHLQVLHIQTRDLQRGKLVSQVVNLLFLSCSLLCLQLFRRTSQQEDLDESKLTRRVLVHISALIISPWIDLCTACKVKLTHEDFACFYEVFTFNESLREAEILHLGWKWYKIRHITPDFLPIMMQFKYTICWSNCKLFTCNS